MVTYSDLGIRPVINAWGTVTVLGGSTIPEEALAAMAEAGRHYVPLHDLLAAAGDYIAKKLEVEAAFISCGAAAGMALSAAACMAGMDPTLRSQLPDTQGLRNEIIIFRGMRIRYDQGFRVAGARLLEIGQPEKTEPWELEMAFSPKTAAVAYIAQSASPDIPSLETVVKMAHAHGIPVIVDAAAEIPPSENITLYYRQGADLTIFSGGKDIRGPQSTGLIIGRKDLVQACAFHSAPNHAVGRGMKVGKEEIMGFVTALDLWLEQDFNQEMKVWETQVAAMVDALSQVPGITARRVFPGEVGIQPIWIPRVYVDWSPEVTQLSPLELKEELLDGEPRLAIGTSDTGLVINPQMLEVGQETIVVECIKRVLHRDAL